MSLSGRLVERLEAALLDAFRDDDALDVLIKRVGMQTRVSSRAPLATRVSKLVEAVDAQGRLPDLLEAACDVAPGNAALAHVRPLIAAELPVIEAIGAVAVTHDAATPTPAYPNAEVRALSARLLEAQARKRALLDSGLATEQIDGEILQLRRQLREGGQLRAGDTLGDGRYLLITIVGRGGFAVVWEAYDRTEHARVAIKVLHANLAGDAQRRERFFRGAQAMRKLMHAAVVPVLVPRGEDGGFYYFVMEFVRGGNLRDAVLARRLAYTDLVPIILQVGEALAMAHARRMVHRDVKPANILLDEQGRAKLTDFDLVGAHDTTGGTRTGALGTVIYAAPECLDRPQDATPRADVYGLGMTAIFCFAGRDLSMDTMRNAEKTIAGLDCSQPLRDVLRRAVAWEASGRFVDAAAMMMEIRKVFGLGKQTVSATRSQPVPRIISDDEARWITLWQYREPGAAAPVVETIAVAPASTGWPSRRRRQLALGGLAGALVSGIVIVVINWLGGPVAVTASVHVASEPAGASVVYDATLLDKSTPLTIDGVPADSYHRIWLLMDGYRPQLQEFIVPADGQLSVVMAKLVKSPVAEPEQSAATRPLDLEVANTMIDANTGGATVEIVGTDQSGPAPLTAKLEKSKRYKARLRAPGFAAAELDIIGGDPPVTVKLIAKPRVISVTSDPPGAAIFVDDKATRFTTPHDVDVPDEAATHPVRIQLRKFGFLTTDRMIDPAKFVEEDTRMIFSLDEELSPALR